MHRLRILFTFNLHILQPNETEVTWRAFSKEVENEIHQACLLIFGLELLKVAGYLEILF
jgi:hypothetical protein